jgi:AcrR family transcriptional regulator
MSATAEQIMEIALLAFIRNGYHGANVQRIARAARCAPVRIYDLFEDKDGLFRSVVSKFIETGYEDLVVAGDDPLADLRTLALRVAERQCKPDQRNGIRLIIANEHRLTDENRAGIVRDRDARRQAFTKTIEDCISAGDIRRADPVSVATQLMGGITAYFLNRGLLNAAESPREAPAVHVDRMISCWTTDAGAARLAELAKA